MTTISWNLSSAPTQTPDHWHLYVDGMPCTSLARYAPYTGAGPYSVNLVALAADMLVTPPLPTDGLAHPYSVALVGEGVIGPQSASVSITLPPPALAPGGQQPPPVVWPTADTLAST